MPVFSSLCSTSSRTPVLSPALPGRMSTAVTSWESVSTTTAALCPSKRLLLLLRPWRISGSCTRRDAVPAYPILQGWAILLAFHILQ